MGYDPSTETLVVQFQNGKLYRYNGVPSDTFVAVITDKASTGKALNRLVLDRAFPYTEVQPDEVMGL
jgi:hypothetical protein